MALRWLALLWHIVRAYTARCAARVVSARSVRICWVKASGIHANRSEVCKSVHTKRQGRFFPLLREEEAILYSSDSDAPLTLMTQVDYYGSRD